MLRVREKKSFGFARIYTRDRNTTQARQLPGECASRLLPVYSLSHDGSRIAVACNSGIGYSIPAWDLGSGQEIALRNADFGFAGGLPTITSGGVALPPDGRYLAVTLLAQVEAMLPNVLLIPALISRSDLRLWYLDKGEEVISVPIDDLVGIGSMGYSEGVDVAFSPDNQMLAVGGLGFIV